ncbi:beta-glucosidase family protein [Algiphilus sp.]|uniref:beta-glucosidase family protein n=1 Tax=Algiphilus sp. TaxID=1872431 RepID=UPI003C39D381
MGRLKVAPAALAGIVLCACGGSEPAASAGGAGIVARDALCGDHAWCDPGMTPEARTALLLDAMTLGQKISLLAGDDVFGSVTGEPANGTSEGIPELGIPTLYFSDGPVGPRKGRATAHPSPALLASTFDPELARETGAVIANEVRNKGAHVVHGPAVDIMRTPVAGRSFESYGEDPLLSARMGTAWIQGAQSQGVVANIKHYTANNQEGQFGILPLTGLVGGRFIVNAVVDERSLREIYLPAFEDAVREGGVGSVMCAYNRVNGAAACSSESLLTDILRGEWGFDGFVLTDYFFAQKNTTPALRAGTDLEMPVPILYSAAAIRLQMALGRVDEALIDERLGNILRTMFRFGFFDQPPFEENDAAIDQEAHARVAREVAEQGTVLLQNDGLLPLRAEDIGSIAVIGAADRIVSGGGSSAVAPFRQTNPLDGIRERAGDGVTVHFTDGSDADAAAALAAEADVAIVFAAVELSEGVDRPCLALSCRGDRPDQDALIERVAAANPRTVAVLQSGTPVLTPWRDRLAALIQAWYPGQEGGAAIARVLFGDVDPGGRLAATFPEREADLPTAGSVAAYPGLLIRAEYREGVLIGYRWYDEKAIVPAFAFGHGLSYTTFAYEDLAVDADGVSFTVHNTGDRAGTTVPQLYVGMPDPAPGIVQPPLQLKGFDKLALAPGERADVRIPFEARSFAYWNAAADAWTTAPGCYRIAVGASSRDIRLEGRLARAGGACE